MTKRTGFRRRYKRTRIKSYNTLALALSDIKEVLGNGGEVTKVVTSRNTGRVIATMKW